MELPKELADLFEEAKAPEPTNHISFLLGSGFSKPDKMPVANDINRLFTGLKVEDFYIFTSGQAGLYNDSYRNPNWRQTDLYSRFLVAFIQFYIASELNNEAEKFQYEDLYDYVYEYRNDHIHQDEIVTFCKGFLNSNDQETVTNKAKDLIFKFADVYEQLVASALMRAKYFENISYIGGYPNYYEFCRALVQILKRNVVNVHTLNHDLLFDVIGRNVSGLWEYFTDGFTEMNSALYGDIRHTTKIDEKPFYKTYKVRVPVYQNNYTNRLKLFKLHGSVDYYHLMMAQSRERVIIKRDYGVDDIYREYFNVDTKKFAYEQSFSRNYPLFLTGRKEKIKAYKDPFFLGLLSHFKSNLTNSSHFFIIGYGFQDQGINESIETEYLKLGKKIMVVDVVTPKSDIIDRYPNQFSFCIGSVEHTQYFTYLEFIADNA
jgi:hypothetical protein